MGFDLLPPWAKLVSLLISIKDVILNVGKQFINFKNNRMHMKTKISQSKANARGVWNTVG
ncbi:hypothetical protein DMB45_08775 [Sanguibacteroides justesenii]|nr:hypothetical protein DMB45_08775 [Sanguibacteroides justesenii]